MMQSVAGVGTAFFPLSPVIPNVSWSCPKRVGKNAYTPAKKHFCRHVGVHAKKRGEITCFLGNSATDTADIYLVVNTYGGPYQAIVSLANLRVRMEVIGYNSGNEIKVPERAGNTSGVAPQMLKEACDASAF